MNVLVYAGPEVVQTSLDNTLKTLRSILLPFYSVQSISQKALISQPWQKGCALLAFPGCRDMFLSKASPEIERYVQNGGSFLAFGTGSHYSSRGLDQGILNVASGSLSKDMLLRFFDKGSGNTLYPSFQQGSNSAAARAVSIKPTAIADRVDGLWQHAPCEFVGTDSDQGNVHVLAHYDEGSRVAGALYKLGNGKTILWGPSPEYSLTEEPLASISSLSPAEIDIAETKRLAMVRDTLVLLGLQLPESTTTIPQPLPQFLVSHFMKPQLVSLVTDALSVSHKSGAFDDVNDQFQFHSFGDSEALLKTARTTAIPPQPKHIIVCADGQIPPQEQTPLFDLTLFFNALSAARKRLGVADDQCGFGDVILYGEVVTSTQTMLDKNPRFMGLLPTPLLSLASQQLAGRGRGANVWLSPAGCLQFSLLLRLSLATFPAAKLVFVQYLFALAVVEACRDEAVLGSDGSAVRLKWPNDIYAVGRDGEPKKIGGILIGTNFSSGKVDIIIGSGLNVLNPPPIMSLSQLSEDERALSMERTAAAILVKFERMWSAFVQGKGSFEPFMDLYVDRWLHSDQLVTLTTTKPHQQVRILGITPEHGLLRTVPETGWSSQAGFIDLQPDGNSFDLMAGLIKAK
ncbi:BPL/LPL catalytic domain-containing protein [Mycena indigotica]|uniref:BPL/LPL catalytic domain-containing protein n=1 Tax=Mycena indigotica TaxID=2126181 RepID=A0A8H6S808_9AGAR|nr:BPL/LPL catalytic domain-containing protein [Mycena indigotica]KAF7292990.1 BPL/LPL catalytic domain-containing protein [Mycena indigotica]